MEKNYCHKHNQLITEDFSCSRCVSNPNDKIIPAASPYFQDAISQILERRDDLANRQYYLRDKVCTLERSIPALMAFNMWMTDKNSEDAPLCKIRELMNKISPNSDATEKLLNDLKQNLMNLDQETAELHDKIIAADVEFEENEMELDSLKLSNQELEERIKELEREVKIYSSPSLHSINSEDLICLTKIRQLGEQEKNLKCCIRQLEEKEAFYRQQIECLITSKQYQNSMNCTKRPRELKETNERKLKNTCPNHKRHAHNMKKKVARDKTKSNLNNNTRNRVEETEEREIGGNDEPVIDIKENEWKIWDQNAFYERSAKCPHQTYMSSVLKAQTTKKSCCCSPVIRSDHLKNKFGLTKPKMCNGPLCGGSIQKVFQKTSCRCSCKGKCAQGKSKVPYYCGTQSESDYHPKAKRRDILEKDSSEDEFRECDCGCNNDNANNSCFK